MVPAIDINYGKKCTQNFKWRHKWFLQCTQHPLVHKIEGVGELFKTTCTHGKEEQKNLEFDFNVENTQFSQTKCPRAWIICQQDVVCKITRKPRKYFFENIFQWILLHTRQIKNTISNRHVKADDDILKNLSYRNKSH